jgi:hypothetical protein
MSTRAPFKSLAGAAPVLAPEAAIGIAKSGLPAMFVAKVGTRFVRVFGKSGRPEFGIPGLDVAHGDFSAALDGGTWRVIRIPKASQAEIEQTCFVDVSAASGRIMNFGLVAFEPAPGGRQPCFHPIMTARL